MQYALNLRILKADLMNLVNFDAELINTLTFDTPDDEEESVKNAAFDECVGLTKKEDIEDIKLGIRRIYGLGMVLDYSPAMLWMGFFSNDILKDYNEAANWFRRAAAQGNGMGMYQYGMLMLENKVAVPSGVSVKRCFTDAFDRGIDEAKSILNKHFS